MDKYVGWVSPKGTIIFLETVEKVEKSLKIDIFKYLGNDCNYCLGNDKDEIVKKLKKFSIENFELSDETEDEV